MRKSSRTPPPPQKKNRAKNSIYTCKNTVLRKPPPQTILDPRIGLRQTDPLESFISKQNSKLCTQKNQFYRQNTINTQEEATLEKQSKQEIKKTEKSSTFFYYFISFSRLTRYLYIILQKKNERSEKIWPGIHNDKITLHSSPMAVIGERSTIREGRI